jgi:topoisomerase-4 subunit A
VKGKGKDKEIETVNLEELIDVKGWKSVGNRLSQYKVTKILPPEEPEDSGNEENDEDSSETTETEKGSQSSKKKEESGSPREAAPAVEEDGQVSLFGESRPEANKSGTIVSGKAPQPLPPKPKAAQADLFGQSQEKEIKKPGQSDKGGKDDRAFGVGETIELDI